jgi:hypothetical protein
MMPRWGWGCGHLFCKTLPIKQACLFLPQHGKILIEQKGYPKASPAGAAQKKRAFRRVLDFRLGGRAEARPELDIFEVKGGPMKAFP